MAPKYRMAAVKEAPVFHPSAEEFADPLRYIASIRAEAEPCGLCRIIPPEGWAVPFNQDPATFAFKTRVQTVNELQLRMNKGKNKTFRVEYVEFMKEHENVTVSRWPVFGGKKLDLRVLYESVARHGGFDAACRAKAWAAIAAGLDAGDSRAADASGLKQLYQKWLLAFERHKKQRGELTPAGKAKEAAATKKEREEERKREKASQAAAERAAAQHEPTSAKEEDLLEALFELGNVAEPPPKRLKLEMVRARRTTRDPRVFSFSFRAIRTRDASSRLSRPTGSPGASVAHTDASRPGARTRSSFDASRATRGAFPASPDPPPRCGSRVRLLSIASDPFLFASRLRVSPTQGLEEVAEQLETFGCQNCGGSAHEDSMILCDGCDVGCVDARTRLARTKTATCPVIGSASVPETRQARSRHQTGVGTQLARSTRRFPFFFSVVDRATKKLSSFRVLLLSSPNAHPRSTPRASHRSSAYLTIAGTTRTASPRPWTPSPRATGSAPTASPRRTTRRTWGSTPGRRSRWTSSRRTARSSTRASSARRGTARAMRAKPRRRTPDRKPRVPPSPSSRSTSGAWWRRAAGTPWTCTTARTSTPPCTEARFRARGTPSATRETRPRAPRRRTRGT